MSVEVSVPFGGRMIFSVELELEALRFAIRPKGRVTTGGGICYCGSADDEIDGGVVVLGRSGAWYARAV